MDKTLGTHGDSINCLITWITSPWINFYLQRVHRPIFLHFHLWQKWAPLQSSAPRRKENWIQHHWKRSWISFCFIKTYYVYIYIYTHILGATVKLIAAITEIWKLIDGWNSSVFQIFIALWSILNVSALSNLQLKLIWNLTLALGMQTVLKMTFKGHKPYNFLF